MGENFTLEEDGFVILRNVFSREFLDARRRILESLISYAEKNYYDEFERYYLRHRADQGVLYDLFQRHPEFDEMVRNPIILEALTEVLGEDITLYENSLVYKPKGKRNGVPWHQDFVSRPEETRKFIAWCAIDDVTRDTGALKVVPGSHKLGFLPWHRVEGETHHDRINLTGVDTSAAIHVELSPGDVLIFNQLLVHCSDEMSTDELRLVFRASFQSFDEIYSPRATPIVVHGGSARSLARRFNSPRQKERPKPVFVRALNKIDRSLANVGS